MQDTIEIKLPISGKSVVIRNYTTNEDDNIAEAILMSGMKVDGLDSNGDKKISFEVIKAITSEREYVNRLVKSIDGNSNDIVQQLSELWSKDYAVVEAAVKEIVEEHSPKAVEARNASNTNTKKI